MNDWLDYKGSGSVQANVVEHEMKFTAGGSYKVPRNLSKVPGVSFHKDSKKYDNINSELDTLYSELSSFKSAMGNMLQTYNQFITAAKTLRARSTIARAKIQQANSRIRAIQSKIDGDVTSLSDMQRTALTNKLNNIKKNKYGAVVKSMNLDTDIDINSLQNLINDVDVSWGYFNT